MNTTFAIVGTAGRKDDVFRLSKNHFQEMCECARILLKKFKDGDYGVDTLVSGGASWADHCAVKLFLNKEIPKLKLFLPCPFDFKNRIFDETPLTPKERNELHSTGKIINYYHNNFIRKVGFNSLNDILMAKEKGAEIIVTKGFYARNAMIAQSDIILAMTFGEREWLKDGGTAHTMMVYLNRVKKYGFFDKSFHYDLNCGEIFYGARIRNVDELSK